MYSTYILYCLTFRWPAVLSFKENNMKRYDKGIGKMSPSEKFTRWLIQFCTAFPGFFGSFFDDDVLTFLLGFVNIMCPRGTMEYNYTILARNWDVTVISALRNSLIFNLQTSTNIHFTWSTKCLIIFSVSSPETKVMDPGQTSVFTLKIYSLISFQ